MLTLPDQRDLSIQHLQNPIPHLTSVDNAAVKIAESIIGRHWKELGEEEITAGLSEHQREIGQQNKPLAAALIFERLIRSATEEETLSSHRWLAPIDNLNVSEMSRSFVYLYKIIMRSVEESKVDKKIYPALIHQMTDRLMHAMVASHNLSFWRGLFQRTEANSAESISIYIQPLTLHPEDLGEGYQQDLITFLEELMTGDVNLDKQLMNLIPVVKELLRITPETQRKGVVKELNGIGIFGLPSFLSLIVSPLVKRRQAEEESVRGIRAATPPPVSASPSLLTKEYLNQFSKWRPEMPSIVNILKLVLLNEQKLVPADVSIDDLSRAVKNTIKVIDKWEKMSDMEEFIKNLNSTPSEQRLAKPNRALVSEASDLFNQLQLRDSIQ